ncbi:putative glutamate carboxypeptidase 2 [Ananas comosus]|uniref:glutamate carboxypeptidase II n=1 Tax=Ananas comosus TaxID=4615 RepID=A0A199VY20_ANACO|nr:putative glutamate carboxypeptidase 2 [Ananas comosus]
MAILASLVVVVVALFLHFAASPISKPTYHDLFLSLSDNSTAARHLRALTLRPHVASSAADAAAAAYVRSALSALALPAHSASYGVLLSFPVRRSLSLAPSPPPRRPFDLVQEPYPGDPYAAAAAEAIPTFHAFAASGAVAGPVAYANYGRVEDFEALASLGVNLTGAVVLARYGKIYRGDIVRNAQDAGAAATVIYTDAKDYGGGAAGKPFPEGPWMPPSGVQIGSTYRGLGDPTTPGWACATGAGDGDGGECERWSVAEVAASGLVPGIPSLPVSARDGEAIHRTIGGRMAPDEWQGEEGSPVYRLGPGPGILNLTYMGNETIATIQNVFAVIEGKEEPDRFVLLGNHRDAWTFGAVDPNSGTAALLELAQRLWKLQKRGWTPRRTIVLCSWDAEEYGLIGSTEWVEENREMLSSRAVAYLNVDSAVAGPGFYSYATPQLDELIIDASKKVQDPDNSSQTLYESWIGSGNSPTIGRLGGGGTDFAAFVQHVGVPSVDIAFGEGYPVYHSLYDDFMWMEKFGDPMFHRHVAAASIWGLVALRLADDEILPFDYVSYALELQIYGPSQHNDYGSKSFPGIDDAIDEAKKSNTSESWRFVQHEVYRVARAVTRASLVLKGKFT